MAVEAMWTTMLCSFGMQQCTNLLHPWYIVVWVCNNAQCNNSEDNLFWIRCMSNNCLILHWILLTECRDKSRKCERFKRNCKSRNQFVKNMMSKKCGFTCGFCSKFLPVVYASVDICRELIFQCSSLSNLFQAWTSLSRNYSVKPCCLLC